MPGGNIARDARRHDEMCHAKGIGPSALYRLGEIREKFVGKFLGGAVDQALAELRQLAADLRLDGSHRSGSYIYSNPSYGPTCPGATWPGTQGAMTKCAMQKVLGLQ